MAKGLSEERVKEMVRIMSSLPPVKPGKIEPFCEKAQCICGKEVVVTQLETLDTGVFKTIGNVCKGCKEGCKANRELARIVCARCKRVIMNVKPFKDKISGFVFQAGKTYHLVECNLCNPDIESAQIIEKTLWERTHADRHKPLTTLKHTNYGNGKESNR